MQQPPWVILAEARRKAGLTQSELSIGIVTQSMLCQIERGRVFPSRKTLQELARRLHLDGELLWEDWQLWRFRQSVRDRVWLAAHRTDHRVIESAIDQYGQLLVPFERCVFCAFVSASRSCWNTAEEWLDTAWRSLDPLSAVGADARSFAGAWTKIDRARALVIEAMTRRDLCRQLGRTVAANYWEMQVQQRLQDTVWNREACFAGKMIQ